MLWLENCVSKMDFDVTMSANEDLYILPWCTTGSMKCTALDTKGPYTLVVEHVPSSAARPAPRPATPARPVSTSSATRPAPAIVLKPATPLYDKFLAALEDENHSEEASSLIRYIEQTCFFGELCYATPSGSRLDTPMPLSCKMESLLEVVLTQRKKIARAAGLDDSQLCRHRATESQMKEMMNAWRKDVKTWMCPDSQAEYFTLTRPQGRQQFAKKRFTTHCFQISGCRYLLNKLIELPLVHNTNHNTAPVLRQFLEDFKEHKNTDKYRDAVNRSKKNLAEQKRLSDRIWWARRNLERGRILSTQVAAGSVAFFDLTWEDQELVEAFDNRKHRKL